MADIHQLFDGMIAHANSTDSYKDGPRPQPADFADERLALRFTSRHQDDLKFVDAWGQWLAWDGAKWQFDDTLLVTDHARILVREASAEILAANGTQKLAAIVASAKTISAIERLARADRKHASRTDDWDTDPWLLNTPTGIIDLRSGQARLHDRRDLITKMTAVGPVL